MPHAIRKENLSRKRNDAPAIAVTAASGKLGHAIAHVLKTHGLANNTRLAVRNPTKLHMHGSSPFEVVTADYENGRSMVSAFSGIDVAFIISSMGRDTTRIRQHRIAIDAAIAAGVKRIIYTSNTAAMLSMPMQWTSAHADTEQYLRQCGIPFTILRVGAYFSNFDYLFVMALHCQRLFFPNTTQPISLVTQEDVADAALRVLTVPGHEKKTYDILAKDTVSMADIAQIMNDLFDTKIIAAAIPVESFIAQLRKQPIPPYAAGMIGDFYAAIAKGACSRTSPDMKLLTGRYPTSAATYLKALIGKASEGGK